MRDRIKKRIGIIIVVVLIIFGITAFFIAAYFGGYEQTIKVEKDAYVSEYYPNRNYGADDYLRVGNYDLGKVYTLYHFNVSSLPDGWTEAQIIVNFDYGSDIVDVGVALINESWDEMTITWNNKPKEGLYIGHILCDGFDFRIPLRSDQIINDGISICLYGRGGEDDGYIRGDSKEGASRSIDTARIELSYKGIDIAILTGLSIFGIIFGIIFGTLGIFTLIVLIREDLIFEKRKKPIKKDPFGADWLNANIHGYNIGKSARTIEKEINEYITLKLVMGRTFIYVNGKRFIQCIRLILNIPKDDVPLYNEVDSIDEAANLYSKHVFQNRIVRGPMAAPVPNQRHDITSEQEFWGHCSNIQAWVEHDYDTRILMSNISFPLLRELVKAGDPKASKVFKEEIAQRLESGYPSVVQYLLNQGYIRYFTPSEFKTVIESTGLIKGLSSDSKVLSRFLIFCVNKFPIIVEDILIQVLKLPEGKKLIISSTGISGNLRMPYLRPSFSSNPQYLLTLKTALGNLFKGADEKLGEDILDCIQAIEDKLLGQEIHLPNTAMRGRLKTLRDLFFDKNVLENLEPEQKLQLTRRFLGEIQRIKSKCAYCGKEIPKGQDTCDWCGHKKDDDEDGFFPYPFIFKPPGGGGGPMKGSIAVIVKNKSQT